MKHPVNRSRAIWSGVLVVLYLCVLLGAVYTMNALLIIVCALILLVCTIFMSRAGSRKLRELRESFFAAVRADERFDVPYRGVVAWTLQCMSPFYCVWVLAGLFLPLGGYEGWLVITFPTLFLSFWILKMVSTAWHDLGLGRARFWILQIVCYAVAVSPGVILASCLS